MDKNLTKIEMRVRTPISQNTQIAHTFMIIALFVLVYDLISHHWTPMIYEISTSILYLNFNRQSEIDFY